MYYVNSKNEKIKSLTGTSEIVEELRKNHYNDYYLCLGVYSLRQGDWFFVADKDIKRLFDLNGIDVDENDLLKAYKKFKEEIRNKSKLAIRRNYVYIVDSDDAIARATIHNDTNTARCNRDLTMHIDHFNTVQRILFGDANIR